MKTLIIFTISCFLFNYVSQVAPDPDPRPPKKNRESVSELHESGLKSHDRSLVESVQAYDEYRANVNNGTWNSTESKPTVKPLGDYPNDEDENPDREKSGGGRNQGRGIKNQGHSGSTTISPFYDNSDESNNNKNRKNSNSKTKNDYSDFPFEDF